MICFKVFDPIDDFYTKGKVFNVKYQTEIFSDEGGKSMQRTDVRQWRHQLDK